MSTRGQTSTINVLICTCKRRCKRPSLLLPHIVENDLALLTRHGRFWAAALIDSSSHVHGALYVRYTAALHARVHHLSPAPATLRKKVFYPDAPLPSAMIAAPATPNPTHVPPGPTYAYQDL